MTIKLLIQSKKPVRCWSCGSSDFSIDSYEHDGGWSSPCGKRWFYLTCSKCGYETSFAKLDINRDAQEATFNTVLKKIHPDVCQHPLAKMLTQAVIECKYDLEYFFFKFQDEILQVLSNK